MVTIVLGAEYPGGSEGEDINALDGDGGDGNGDGDGGGDDDDDEGGNDDEKVDSRFPLLAITASIGAGRLRRTLMKP